MDAEPDRLTTDKATRPIAHRGILIAMAVLIGLGTVAGVVFSGLLWGVGVMFGGVLSLVNYVWLKRSTSSIFERAEGANTGLLAAKYILRYVVIGAVLLLIYLTGAFPIVAVIAGLSAFAVAVVIEGLRSIIVRN